MSRHRLVKQLNIHEELEDDALSDGGEEGMTQEQEQQMADGLEQVRATLGSEEETGISDQAIRSALWESYFDVEGTIGFLLYEQERKRAAEERRVKGHKELPPLPPGEEDDFYNDDAAYLPMYPVQQRPVIPRALPGEMDEYDEDGSYESSEPGVFQRKLSTISERTERSDTTVGRTLSPLAGERATSMATTTDYGEQIATTFLLDPDRIAASPSPSAAEHLHSFEGPPSLPRSGSRTPSSVSTATPPRSPPPPLPPIENIPEIPDSSSRSTQQVRSQQAPAPREVLERRPISTITERTEPSKVDTGKRKSKLSALADSRRTSALSTGTGLSRTTEAYTVESMSTATYPELRPSHASQFSLHSTVSHTSTASSASGTSGTPSASTESTITRHARLAVDAALGLDSKDRIKAASPRPESVASSHTYSHVGRDQVMDTSTAKPLPSTPAPSEPLPTPSPAPAPAQNVQSKDRQPSKLALLAQAKAAKKQSQRDRTHGAKPPVSSSSKARLSHNPLHEPHTEYLTPIGNGASATTAITTQYQSLNDLIPPQKSGLPPSYPPSATTLEPKQKQSKLAMKAQRTQQKHLYQPQTSEEERHEALPPELPMFLAKTSRNRASPSAFAVLLTEDDPLLVDPEVKEAGRKKRSEKGERHHHNGSRSIPVAPHVMTSGGFGFDSPSPDDVVFNARRGTTLAAKTPRDSNARGTSGASRASQPTPAKQREKEQKLAQQKRVAEIGFSSSRASSAAASRAGSPIPGKMSKKGGTATPKKSGTSTPIKRSSADQKNFDLSALNLNDNGEPVDEELPKMSMAREKLIEEVKKTLEAESAGDKKRVNLVVIGHVDAGKSTLMGRLLYEIGKIEEKKRIANERASGKMGKSSFSWAWELDGTLEERERGITMDIALQSLSTPHRHITILDAPGHRDFIPNMISGAAQADSALLVVDAATGEFEAGFDRGGQTREHLLLVRSLGVSQVVVAVNKLDQVQWDKGRYEEICGLLQPFLLQSGFHPSKTNFVPVGAMAGVNLTRRDGPDAHALTKWYDGPTLVDLLDVLEPPARDISAPLRFPISNIFKGQGSGIGVSGRVCGGIVQVGERLRILPGDETGVVKSIESEEETLPWAADGSSVTLHLTNVDPVHLTEGSVLCPPTDVIPLATTFVARILVFDIQVPITAGASVELFHHSHDVPASVTKLLSTLDRGTGDVIKKNPRVLTKGVSAEVQITLRNAAFFGPSTRPRPIPLETFATNKEMGRILIRREGETIGAGIVLEIIS